MATLKTTKWQPWRYRKKILFSPDGLQYVLEHSESIPDKKNQKKNFELFLKKQRTTALCFKKPNVLLPYILDFENLSKSITRKIMVGGI